jgi:hypothetical protein
MDRHIQERAMRFKQLAKKSEYGLVLNWKFHKENQWVSAFAPYMVREILRVFDPIIISSQLDYALNKKKLKFIISMEPGWAAPKISYDKHAQHIICVFASDPHNKTGWFQEYVQKNNITFVLSQYYQPFLYHFPDFPREKFVHFPWAVPDQFVSSHRIQARSSEIAIFGGAASEAYDLRNWCRQQQGITSYSNSGVENKTMSDAGYFQWLATFDAAVAAGSSDPKYDLVTPKYFEIASAGVLLIGQYCKDIDLLGFNETNALIFTKKTFIERVHEYRKSPDTYIAVRERGRELIKERHLIKHRIALLSSLFNQQYLAPPLC